MLLGGLLLLSRDILLVGLLLLRLILQRELLQCPTLRRGQESRIRSAVGHNVPVLGRRVWQGLPLLSRRLCAGVGGLR